MMNSNDEIRSEREVIRMIRERELRGDSIREEENTCPGWKPLLRIANDEEFPEGPAIHEHLKVCPLCRFTYRTFLAAVKDDPSLDPHDESTDSHPRDPDRYAAALREWLGGCTADAPTP